MPMKYYKPFWCNQPITYIAHNINNYDYKKKEQSVGRKYENYFRCFAADKISFS